jgi:purine-binding chemotaxis protein CheW
MTRFTAQAAQQAPKAICFWLSGQQLGVPIEHVKETIVLRPITHVFLTPRWIAGLINLRGDVVAVLDLAGLLGLPPTGFTDETRIVITRSGGKTAGLLVDRLAEARSYDRERLEPPPATLPVEAAELVAGVATLEDGVPLVLLDLERLLHSERLKPFSRRT